MSFCQGNTSFGWPWGNDLDDSKMPPFTSDPKQPLAEPVGGFPEAASWAGIEDLVGSVYQWTDVFTDEHTSRYILLCNYGCLEVVGLSYYVKTLSQTLGQYSGAHLGGTRMALTGTNLSRMALTSPGNGRHPALSSSRTQCFCSPTAWIAREASVSVVLLRNRREMNKE